MLGILPFVFKNRKNVPLILGDIKITESNAIIRYIARKHGLDGKTEEVTGPDINSIPGLCT
jgi:hypothetical protein